MANEYATSAELKVWMRIGVADVVDDTAVALAVEAASRLIDNRCGRRFYAATETRIMRTFNPEVCFVDDLLSITTLKQDLDGDGVFETLWAATDYSLHPRNAANHVPPAPYSEIRCTRNGTKSFAVRRDDIEIVGSWGFAATVPPAIKQATLIQATVLFKRKDSPLGVAGASSFGQLIMMTGTLDNTVELILSNGFVMPVSFNDN